MVAVVVSVLRASLGGRETGSQSRRMRRRYASGRSRRSFCLPTPNRSTVLRIVVRPHLNQEVTEIPARDIEAACEYLEQHGLASRTSFSRPRQGCRSVGVQNWRGMLVVTASPPPTALKSANCPVSRWAVCLPGMTRFRRLLAHFSQDKRL